MADGERFHSNAPGVAATFFVACAPNADGGVEHQCIWPAARKGIA